MWAPLLLIGVPGLFRFYGLAIRLSFSIWFTRVGENGYRLNGYWIDILSQSMYNYNQSRNK